MKYEILGTSDTGAATVFLSAGLGGSSAFWEPQLSALTEHFRVVLYDQRGTGKNSEPLPSGYSLSDMADEVVTVLDSASIGRCHFIGHALGGLVGLDLALRHPERLDRLVLVNAWDRLDSHTARCFAVREALLNAGGSEAYVKAQPIFLYPAAWLSEHAERIAKEEAHGIQNFQGKDNLLKRINALRAFDVSTQLSEIHTETLVMATRDDMLVPWTCSQRLATGLPNSRFDLSLEGGHASCVTEALAFNTAVMNFLV
jgi:aminoacrylate hydrolase